MSHTRDPSWQQSEIQQGDDNGKNDQSGAEYPAQEALMETPRKADPSQHTRKREGQQAREQAPIYAGVAQLAEQTCRRIQCDDAREVPAAVRVLRPAASTSAGTIR